MAWEHREVDFVLNVVHDLFALLGRGSQSLAEKDHCAPRPSQGLVGRCRHYIRILKWAVYHLSCDEAADVCHVGEEVGTYTVCDLPHPSVIDLAGICRCP